MKLSGALHLGRCYLRRHRAKTALLVAAITLSVFLPTAVILVVGEAEAHLRERSRATPLVLGAPGSPLELVFNAIYFGEPAIATVPWGVACDAAATREATTIPIHARFDAQGHRVVGTSIDYLDLRGLRVRDGRAFIRTGECVIGASLARRRDLGVGDTLTTSPEQAFDLAGTYPLRMEIVGVLEPTGTADDGAAFADLKTMWIAQGLAHGHDQVALLDEEAVLERDADGRPVLNASVREFTEITDANRDSFHFHGDPDTFPVTSAILVPRDARSETILLGRFVGGGAGVQIVRPDDVMEGLFATVFRVRDLVLAALVAVGAMAAAIAVLVFVLSNRLRGREFESLANLGADRATVRLLVGFEALFVGLVSLALATGLGLGLHAATPALVRLLAP